MDKEKEKIQLRVKNEIDVEFGEKLNAFMKLGIKEKQEFFESSIVDRFPEFEDKIHKLSVEIKNNEKEIEQYNREKENKKKEKEAAMKQKKVEEKTSPKKESGPEF